MINYEKFKGNFNNFHYYELAFLPDKTIALVEGHDKPGQYVIEVLNKDFVWDFLLEDSFPNKTQAVMLAKDVLTDA